MSVRYKILLVDDETEVIHSMVDILKENKEYVFYQALNGKMAYKIALAKIPDLIITDWVMPEINGIELIKKIKSDTKLSHIPIMMATGTMMTFQDLDIALNAGADDYVRKPINKIELRARVRSMLVHSEFIKTIKKKNKQLTNQKEKLHIQSEELRSITDQLKDLNLSLEKKIEKRTYELNLALEKAKDAQKLISSFLSNISHEIRTPMNAISGFSQIITQTDISDEQREQYNTIISQSVDSLQEQIDNIIHVSKMHSGNYVMKNNVFSLNMLLKELLEDFNNRKELQKENVLLKWKHSETPDDINLFADKQLFKQIIHQLVSNALKYTEKGEVVLGYELHQKEQNTSVVFKIADKKAQEHETILTIFVKDTGVGIDKKQQKHIFDVFKKIEGKEKLFRGTGLGLAIVKSLCANINAKIKVKSSVNEGSVFTIKVALSNN